MNEYSPDSSGITEANKAGQDHTFLEAKGTEDKYLTEGRKVTLPLVNLNKGSQLVNPVLPRLGREGIRSYWVQR
nr:unnamed protein product [Digitaria exilis]